MKEEDVLDATEAVKSLHLPPEAVATQKALMQVMKTVRFVSIEDFQNFHETRELQGGDALGESVALLLYDPSNNVRC